MDTSSNSIPQNSEKSTENVKKVSNERQSNKTYHRADASAVIDQVVSEHLIFDKKTSNPKGLLVFLVETVGIEPMTSTMST